MPGLFQGTSLERPVTCEACEKPLADCRCPRDAAGAILPPSKQTASIRIEKRNKGKTVTVIAGLDPVASDLESLLGELKSACGTGGAIDDGAMTLQGDQREKAAARLRAIGYKVKGA